MSPLVFFPLLWCVGVALAALITPPGFDLGTWTGAVWIVMAVTPLAFVLGGLAGRGVATRRLPLSAREELTTDAATALPALRRLLVGALFVGYAELGYQFVSAGAIPLLNSHIDATRATQPGGPPVVLINLLALTTIAALCAHRRLLCRAALPEIILAAAGVSGFLLSGGRGEVFLALGATVIARSLLYGPPRARTAVIGALVGLSLSSGIFFLRTYQHRNTPFERVLYSRILPDTPAVLRPYWAVHFGYATNFDVLAAVVRHFPASEPYHPGRYSLSGFDLAIPGTRPMGSVTSHLTGPFVTSTAAGPYVADGGVPLLILGMALIGFAATGSYTVAVRRRSYAWCLFAGYLLYMTAFAVYTNLWTDHPDWVFALPGLLVFGAVGTGRLTARASGGLPPRLYVDGRPLDFRSVLPVLARLLNRIAPHRLLSRKATLGSIGALAVLVAGGAVYELVRDPKPVPTKPVAPLPVGVRLKLPAAASAPGALVATDGDLPGDNTPLWIIGGVGHANRVTEFSFSTVPPNSRLYRVKVPKLTQRERFDVGTWTQGPALFEMKLGPNSILTTVTNLGKHVFAESRAKALLPEPPSGHRDVAIATYSGALPDLYVVDRGRRRERVEITVLSGESGFRKVIMSRRAPIRNLDPKNWAVDVSRVIGRRPSLLSFSRAGTGSGHPEEHVLNGNSGFRTFALHQVLGLAPYAVTPQIGSGLVLDHPSIYVMDPVRRQLLTLPIAPPR